MELKDDTQVLDEVVVVGFGTQKKVNLTGSVAVVGAEELTSRPVSNVTQAMQGLVPGMNFGYGKGGGKVGSTMSINFVVPVRWTLMYPMPLRWYLLMVWKAISTC